ncbi:MAG: hypothetical protein CL942_12965 [Desulfovibrio sp.]|nr:hypothetical protein [Desulfovibrio sp.]|tara:strand:+ start:188 stop:430 length:243 start_codon:yes stop_codon:yes gene_type:complete
MEEKKVTPKSPKSNPESLDLVFWEPVADLYAAAQSLDSLASNLDEKSPGEANMLRLISKQIGTIAEHMDNNNWKAEKEFQ